MGKSLEQIFNQAVVFEKQKDFQKARDLYEELLRINPDHTGTLINLGLIFFHNYQEYKVAEDHLLSAIKISPKCALAYFALGNLWYDMGQFESAIGAYKRALEILPNYADVHYNLALTYEKKACYRNALVHWRRFVQLDLVGSWTDHARCQIKEILDRDVLKIVANNPHPRKSRRRCRPKLRLLS